MADDLLRNLMRSPFEDDEPSERRGRKASGAGGSWWPLPIAVAVGGLVALVGLYAAFRLLLPSVAYGLEFFLGSSTPRFFDAAEMGALVCAGAVLGVTGSLSALLGWRA